MIPFLLKFRGDAGQPVWIDPKAVVSIEGRSDEWVERPHANTLVNLREGVYFFLVDLPEAVALAVDVETGTSE